MAGNNTGYPSIFKMDGEEFMIGSEVGLYLGMVRGALYKKFPSLWRRVASSEERKKIIELLPHNTHALSSCITLLKSEEAMEIIKGVGERYRRGPFISSLKERSTTIISEEERTLENDCAIELPLITSNFQCTPAAQYPVNNKRIRSFPLFIAEKNNNFKEELIPIILDITANDIVLKDYFIWNIYDNINIDAFAELLCDDLDIPSNIFIPLIVSSINNQILTYKNVILNNSVTKNQIEKRVIIKLNIYLDDIHYEDQFEWDIFNMSSNPEQFAALVVKELGLPLQFIPRIIIDIRCQLNWYRSIYSQHENIYLSPLVYPPIRDLNVIDDWTPKVSKISPSFS